MEKTDLHKGWREKPCFSTFSYLYQVPFDSVDDGVRKILREGTQSSFFLVMITSMIGDEVRDGV